VDYYYDTTCSSSFETQTSSFDQCLQLYSSTATEDSPSFSNFVYGICQSESGSPSTSTSSSDDDEVSFTESEYAGAVTGTLICGTLIGAVAVMVVLVFCCGYRSPGGGDKGSSRADSSNEPSNQQKSTLSQPIIDEQEKSDA
jgi:hypothetical protein